MVGKSTLKRAAVRTEYSPQSCFREGLFHATVDSNATVSALIRGRIPHTSHLKHQVDLDVRRQICRHLLLSGDGAHSRSTGNYTGNQERNYIMLFQGC